MQPLTVELTQLVLAKAQFRIKFNQYDGGIHIFYPNYDNPAGRICCADVIAWVWGNSLRFGIVHRVTGGQVKIKMITRLPDNVIHTSIKVTNIACILQME